MKTEQQLQKEFYAALENKDFNKCIEILKELKKLNLKSYKN